MKCPKCQSTEVEKLDVVDVIDQVDEDKYNKYYEAIYLAKCLICGNEFTFEDSYVEAK